MDRRPNWYNANFNSARGRRRVGYCGCVAPLGHSQSTWNAISTPFYAMKVVFSVYDTDVRQLTALHEMRTGDCPFVNLDLVFTDISTMCRAGQEKQTPNMNYPTERIWRILSKITCSLCLWVFMNTYFVLFYKFGRWYETLLGQRAKCPATRRQSLSIV